MRNRGRQGGGLAGGGCAAELRRARRSGGGWQTAAPRGMATARSPLATAGRQAVVVGGGGEGAGRGLPWAE